jgi:sortase A
MKQKTLLRVAAIISGISGLVILIGVIYPIVSYDKTYSKNYTKQKLISPLADSSGQVQGILTASTKGVTDDTNASSWFMGGASQQEFSTATVSYYTISIPKLKIDSANVAIGGSDLSKSLIQYPGTALPGKRGNSVIFGHSILPIFNNPKNYISIFTMLPSLKKGDLILINYDTISYKYKVEEMFEVLPTDIQVLDQDSSDSFVTLVTCVPPGDPRDPKRLIVRARVVPPDQNANID